MAIFHSFSVDAPSRQDKFPCFLLRGISSVGRALAWHARGQEFDSPMLHQVSQRRDDGLKRFSVLGVAPKALLCRNLHINQLPIGTIIWVNVNEHASGA